MRNLNLLATLLFAALLPLFPASVSAQAGVQDPSVVVSEVESFLLSQAAALPGAAEVVVTPPRITRQASCEHLDVFLPNPQLRSRMNVGVRCLSPQPWTLFVQASLSVNGYYYVTNRRMEPGEAVSMDDLVAREGDLLRLPRGVVTDPALAVGYIVTQRMTEGTTLRASALRDPDSIVKGQPVRTEARGVGFVATGEGVALEDGAPGAMIQVRTSSGQTVTGTVINNTTVRILM